MNIHKNKIFIIIIIFMANFLYDFIKLINFLFFRQLFKNS
jgi:hypothetical protein